jgi:hypothetical protein
VPSPGHGLDLFVERAHPGARSSSFGIFVSDAGIVSYEFNAG